MKPSSLSLLILPLLVLSPLGVRPARAGVLVSGYATDVSIDSLDSVSFQIEALGPTLDPAGTFGTVSYSHEDTFLPNSPVLDAIAGSVNREWIAFAPKVASYGRAILSGPATDTHTVGGSPGAVSAGSFVLRLTDDDRASGSLNLPGINPPDRLRILFNGNNGSIGADEWISDSILAKQPADLSVQSVGSPNIVIAPQSFRGGYLGDLNADGKWDIKDVNLALALANKQLQDSWLSFLADIDDDGQVTKYDVTRLLNYVDGTSSSLF